MVSGGVSYWGDSDMVLGQNLVPLNIKIADEWIFIPPKIWPLKYGFNSLDIQFF